MTSTDLPRPPISEAPSPRPDEGHRDYVAALARGLAVIQAFTEGLPEMTLSEVAQATGMTPATARRALLTLQSLGYVGANGRRFLLLPKVLSLGAAYLSSMNLHDVVQPFLQEVADRFRDAVSLAILDGDSVVYLAHVPSSRRIVFRASVGYRLPVHCTSLGLALLAHAPQAQQDALLAKAPFQKYTPMTLSEADQLRTALEQVREQGYALQESQLEIGVLSVAVPVRDASRRVIAAVNCSTESGRADTQNLLSERLPALREAAAMIESALLRAPALAHSITAAG
ncbi:IclR family transcriptional regulator C-terminal domain-containing protein [Cupriavidus metallidurans]|uniref:IclR family transcriptional regulator domain-containing protein n=1 Tax=Cupriavidus metallidurans TaxID=119219 RepID=UPI001CCF371B|nr:IclR family transcriptional regulator C-terminal domain-containing protein [Cupriavidus metallidurans]UBM07611.1 helix-turn-helix domain-containing protein [Cupriavidus metallidurans]